MQDSQVSANDIMCQLIVSLDWWQAVHKGERISQDCIACGHHGIINMQHRLITYIVKNPPGMDSAATPSKKYVQLQ